MERERTSEELFAEASRLGEALARALLVFETHLRAGAEGTESLGAISANARALEALGRSAGVAALESLAGGVVEVVQGLATGRLVRGERALELLLEGVDDVNRLVHAAGAAESDVHPARYRAAIAAALAARDEASGAAQERAARVEVGKLDALLGLVGDLGAVEHALDRLTENLRGRGGDDALAREARHLRRRLRRGLSALRDGVLEARVVRLDRLFAGAVERVHELAAERGQRVRVITRGGDVEIDRVIADELDELLLQLARNAVVHGVEPASERLASGKPETATIELAAEAGAGRLRLCVADDGAGVATEALRARVIEHAILPADIARALAPGAVAQLAFGAGLWTAADDARGAGLDAVRATVARLGGGLELESVSSGGARFTLSLPLGLVRLHAFTFDVCGLPMAVVRDAVHAVHASHPDADGRARAMLDDAGASIPIRRLADDLRISSPRDERHREAATLLVIDVAGQRNAFAVDRVRGHAQLVVKPFGPTLSSVRAFVGAADLDSGELALVLDPTVPWSAADGASAARTDLVQASSSPAGDAAVARAFVIELGATRRALDLSKVRGVEPAATVTPVPGAPVGVVGVASVRGAVTTVLDGRCVSGEGDGAAGGPFVLVDVGDEIVALRVDRVVGVSDATASADERPRRIDLALTPRRARD